MRYDDSTVMHGNVVTYHQGNNDDGSHLQQLRPAEQIFDCRGSINIGAVVDHSPP